MILSIVTETYGEGESLTKQGQRATTVALLITAWAHNPFIVGTGSGLINI